MIHYTVGDIFDSPAQTLVNPVNTVGVMGKGLALLFKNRYPDMFGKYKSACDNGSLIPGRLMLIHEPDHWVLLFPTKRHWRESSRLDYIEQGLKKIRYTYGKKYIRSIAIPKIGCGCGGLAWSDVKPLIEKYLSDLPIDIYVYE